MNEYVAQPMSDLCMWAFCIGLISTAIFLLLLAQRTMRRIEKQIRKDGLDMQQPLDFGGSKIVTYAYAIVLPEHLALRIERLIDVRLVRRYANKVDSVIGMLFIMASHLWILSILLCSFRK
jgi:hypothetical protein